MWAVVRHRFDALGIRSKGRGPHALRHACATHLLKKGTPLKDIADFLGHRNAKAVGIYAKFDTRFAFPLRNPSCQTTPFRISVGVASTNPFDHFMAENVH